MDVYSLKDIHSMYPNFGKRALREMLSQRGWHGLRIRGIKHGRCWLITENAINDLIDQINVQSGITITGHKSGNKYNKCSKDKTYGFLKEFCNFEVK